MSDQKPASRLVVAGTVTFYLVAAIAMVIANKWVLNETKTPLFFLLTQLFIAVLLFGTCHLLGLLKLPRTIDPAIVKGLAPLIGTNVMGLSFNNYCLKYVDASFYQVARGLVLPITVLTSAYLLHTRPSSRVLSACFLVTGGFFVGVFLDRASSAPASPSAVPPSAIGVMFGLLSSVTTAVQAVVIKRSLDVVGGSAVDLAWYNNLLSAVVLAPLVLLVGEAPDVMQMLFGADVIEIGKTSAFWTFIYGSAVTGLFGFLINIAGFMSIKVTSPITHMVSSAVKGVLQSILGVWLFHDIITGGRATSITLILVGSIYYTWAKNREGQDKDRAKTALPTSAYEPVPLKERGSA